MEILNLSKIFSEKKIEDFSKVDAVLLQKIIRIHDELYFKDDAPIIWDTEYDLLKKKVGVLEDKFDLEKLSEIIGDDTSESTFEKKNTLD